MQSVTPLCHVNFLGFQARVIELERRGWDCSLEQVRTPGSFEVEMRLAIHNKELSLYGMSNITRYDIRESLMGRDVCNWNFPDIVFNVMAVAPNVRVVLMPVMGLGAPCFQSVDFAPTIQTHNEEIDLMTLLPFSAKKPQEIIIDPGEVNMWLDKLLDAQKPQQDQIRKRKIIANIVS